METIGNEFLPVVIARIQSLLKLYVGLKTVFAPFAIFSILINPYK